MGCCLVFLIRGSMGSRIHGWILNIPRPFFPVSHLLYYPKGLARLDRMWKKVVYIRLSFHFPDSRTFVNFAQIQVVDAQPDTAESQRLRSADLMGTGRISKINRPFQLIQLRSVKAFKIHAETKQRLLVPSHRFHRADSLFHCRELIPPISFQIHLTVPIIFSSPQFWLPDA